MLAGMEGIKRRFQAARSRPNESIPLRALLVDGQLLKISSYLSLFTVFSLLLEFNELLLLFLFVSRFVVICLFKNVSWR